ncbi:MAG: hypothetical protein HY319_01540 [Armatimonadetes bacterium]|nr:hypothetical protein [Armatimonadota bacterium]
MESCSDHRHLARIRRDGEGLRERPSEICPLHLPVEAARRYLDLVGTLAELRLSILETAPELALVVDAREEGLDVDPTWVELCERGLSILHAFPLEDPDPQEPSQEMLHSLEALGRDFDRLDLVEMSRRLQAARDAQRILESLEQDIDEEELEAGRFQQVENLLEALLDGLVTPEEAHDRLHDLLEELSEQRGRHEQDYVNPEEWTVEAALSDRFLWEGIEDWLRGLEGLCQACWEPTPASLRPGLETLLEGHRKLLNVDLLARPRDIHLQEGLHGVHRPGPRM